MIFIQIEEKYDLLPSPCSINSLNLARDFNPFLIGFLMTIRYKSKLAYIFFNILSVMKIAKCVIK